MDPVTRKQVVEAIVASLKQPWPNAENEINGSLPRWMNLAAAIFFEENRTDEHAEILRRGMRQLTKDGFLQ